MATKTGELRDMLIDAIAMVKNGKMDSDDANAVAKLAGAVNTSLQVEINAIKELRALGVKIDLTPGGMQVGAIDVTPTPLAIIATPKLEAPTADPDAMLRVAAREQQSAGRVVKGSRY